LRRLATHDTEHRWPRATIIRRAGTARRRTHAIAGAALVVVALVLSGVLVTDAHGVHPTLASAGRRLASVPAGGALGQGPSGHGVVITPSSMMSQSQVGRALHGGTWRVTGTDPRQHTAFPCQRRAYADPHASTALVRHFTARGQPRTAPQAAVQSMEVSADARAAQTGYRNATQWFAGCTTPLTQLVAVRRVQRLGDQAAQYVLRTWGAGSATYVVGVARTGQINTLTLTHTSGARTPSVSGNLRLLAAAVANLCVTSLGGPCASSPRAVAVAPPAVGTRPSMLSELDLPPAAGVTDPWVGTTPSPALDNVAATGCDRSSFHGHGWRHDATRSFLVPGGQLTASFGITETVGRLPTSKAKSFVSGVKAKLASCPHRQLGTKVQRVASGSSYAVWRVRTEVSNTSTLTFYMGIVRAGGAVAQVGFVPDGRHTMTTADFVALVHRAGQRLTTMPS
jgi:hypothetical protein